MSEECVHIEDIDLAKFFHDLFLSHMDFMMSVIPLSRMKKVTEYIRDTMYNFTDFGLLRLIRYNDPAATLERYRRCLESNALAGRIVLGSRREEFSTKWRITVNDCVFGSSCRGLRAQRYVCPMALFAGFLVQEAGVRGVRVEPSRPTIRGCETEITVWEEPFRPERISLRG